MSDSEPKAGVTLYATFDVLPIPRGSEEGEITDSNVQLTYRSVESEDYPERFTLKVEHDVDGETFSNDCAMTPATARQLHTVLGNMLKLHDRCSNED